MKQRFYAFLGAVLLLLSHTAVLAETSHLRFTSVPSYIRPGRTERISIAANHEGTADLFLRDANGGLTEIRSDIPVMPGENQITWNGYGQGPEPLPQGNYQMVLYMDDDAAEASVSIGPESPRISQLRIDDAHITPGKNWTLSALLNMQGTLMVVFHIADQVADIFNSQVPAGETTVSWDGYIEGAAPPEGQHTLSVLFIDESGFAANQQLVTVTVGPVVAQTPAAPATQAAGVQETPIVVSANNTQEMMYTLPTEEVVAEEDEGSDYWKLPIGKWDEEAIWKVMLQPITVVVGGDQRETYKLRAAKDTSMKRENILGEITYEAQGVHIIEQTGDGWSLVEAYNSSYGPDNRTRRGYGDTDDLIRGYIETKYLKTITPRDDYGLLIDKLKQRMYVFKDGKLFTELLISTGIPTKQQPWNETPSGEFLMVSRVGQFNAGNLVCRMAMRINGGALIHEVPYIENQSTGYWDYSSQEAQLGKKASHGCIRVQRLNNVDGINMTWLWDNIKVNTKVLVWDDFPGRFYEYPDPSLALYYNPDRGQFYHLEQNCRSIKDRYLPLKGEMTYGELDGAGYQKLTPCKSCNPPIRRAEIDQINRDNGF